MKTRDHNPRRRSRRSKGPPPKSLPETRQKHPENGFYMYIILSKLLTTFRGLPMISTCQTRFDIFRHDASIRAYRLPFRHRNGALALFVLLPKPMHATFWHFEGPMLLEFDRIRIESSRCICRAHENRVRSSG
jgi:hypothetical protein